MEDTFPDLGSLSDKELKDMIDNLTAEENEISYKRRVLHGKIDILRAELVNRLRDKHERGDSMISGDDVSKHVIAMEADLGTGPVWRLQSRVAAESLPAIASMQSLLAPLSMFDRCVGEIFNLGMDVAISTGEGIRIVEEIVGRPARIARQPRRAGDQTRTQANITKARRVLGYNPTTTPQEGLAQTVAWYRASLTTA